MYEDADHHLAKAKDHIKEAVGHLAQITVHNCSGHNSYVDDYKRLLHDVFLELMSIKKRLEI